MPDQYAYISAAGAATQAAIGNYLSNKALRNSLKNFTPAQVNLLGLPDMQQQYLSQGANLDQIGTSLDEVNAKDNEAFQNRLAQVSPTLKFDVGDFTKRAGDLSQGIVPKDVQDQVKRQSAYQALQGGYGEGGGGTSPMAQGNEALNQSRASMAAMQQGSEMLGQGMGMTMGLNPANLQAGDTLIDTHDVLARQDAKNYYNNRLENQRRQMVATARSISPWGAALTGAVGAYTGALAGGGGGGGMGGMGGGGMFGGMGGMGGGGGGGGAEGAG